MVERRDPLVTQDSGTDPAHNSVAVAGASADGSVLYLTASPFQLFAGVSIFRFSGGQLTPLTLTSPSFSNSYGPSTSICATSADGATVYVNTFANIAPSDTDPSSGLGGRKDLYRISGGQATLVSAGPAGSSAPFDASCAGASTDGARVFFTTGEALVAADTDSATDLYEWEGSSLSLISTGNRVVRGSAVSDRDRRHDRHLLDVRAARSCRHGRAVRRLPLA